MPAGAGNTLRAPQGLVGSAVYPRSRGEHAVDFLSDLRVFGLSPLARGTLFKRYRRGDDSRFIPARAGNTTNRRSLAPYAPVYPRSRGEHFSNLRPRKNIHGLSPLARGTLETFIDALRNLRFIPARAGNTPILAL
ncbi:hypothetical protein CTU_10520 [Cronobacter turicensis z3032]|nr:hypothetical protein CTU_10520 [Cronobacter turicensis z3032]